MMSAIVQLQCYQKNDARLAPIERHKEGQRNTIEPKHYFTPPKRAPVVEPERNGVVNGWRGGGWNKNHGGENAQRNDGMKQPCA